MRKSLEALTCPVLKGFINIRGGLSMEELISRLGSLKDSLGKIRKEVEVLEKDNPSISKYLQLKYEAENIRNSIKNVELEIQSKCVHPIWYFRSKEDDEYEGRRYFTCVCLECEHIKEDRGKNFDKVIYAEERYKWVKELYDRVVRVISEFDLDYDYVYKVLQDKTARKTFI